MDYETKDFDEKEEYKKLFKIRDEIIMNMQTVVQPSGVGFFNPNASFGTTSMKSKPLEAPKYPHNLSETTLKHKHLSAPSGVSAKEDRNRLERVLRARIEKRKADAKLLTEQGPCKKYSEQRTFSNQVHYRRNKEPWDVKPNTRSLSYDTTMSYSNTEKEINLNSKQVQELPASGSSLDHNEELKEHQTIHQTIYCENKNTSTVDFLSTSMAIPGLRVSAYISEENLEKPILAPIISQDIQEKNIQHDQVTSNNSPINLPDLPLESKLVSYNFQTYESSTQNRSRSSSLEYEPRSPNSHLHLSPLLSPKTTVNVVEPEKLTKVDSISEPMSYCQATNENMQSANQQKGSKENKKIDNCVKPDDSSNLTEQHNHESHKQAVSPRSMYWRHGYYPYYHRPSTPVWYNSRNYPSHFFPDENPYIHFQDRVYHSTHFPPPVGMRDYDHYYMSEFSAMRPPLSPRITHPYPLHPIRYSHMRPFPQSPPLHGYQYSKSSTPAYLHHPYPHHTPIRYDDSMGYGQDTEHLYQSRNIYQWEDPREYDHPSIRSGTRPIGFTSRYEGTQSYNMNTEPASNATYPIDHCSNDWDRERWSRGH